MTLSDPKKQKVSVEEILEKGEKIKVPDNEFRGFTYVNELMDQFDRIMNLPSGTYHVGSKNDISRYDIVCLILREMGLSHRIEELIIRDSEKWEKPLENKTFEVNLKLKKWVS